MITYIQITYSQDDMINKFILLIVYIKTKYKNAISISNKQICIFKKLFVVKKIFFYEWKFSLDRTDENLLLLLLLY